MGYSHERYAVLIAETFEKVKNLSRIKGGEYAGDTDRLANFRRNGLALGLPMETVWAVYAAKHWDAIQQSVKDKNDGIHRERLEPITGRVDDLIVYLLLFKAILEERETIPPTKFDNPFKKFNDAVHGDFGSLQPTDT